MNDHQARVPQGRSGPDSADSGGEVERARAATPTALALDFLVGQTSKLTNPVLVGLHQALGWPEWIRLIVRAHEQGARLAAQVEVRGRSFTEIIRDPAFDWGPEKSNIPWLQKDVAHPGNQDSPLAHAEGVTEPKGDVVLSHGHSAPEPDEVRDYCKQLRACVEAWGLRFDPTIVRLDTIDRAGHTTKAIVLKWPDAWGSPPTSPLTDADLRPIDARIAHKAVRLLPGWSKLDADARSKLGHLIEGETNELSHTARDYLRSRFLKLSKKDPKSQAHDLKAVLTTKDALPDVVDEHVSGRPVKLTLSTPKIEKHFKFRGKTVDAKSWTAHYSDKTKIEIIAPKAPDPHLHNHTAEQAADAARFMPHANRALIHQIVLNVAKNPDDAYWATEYKTPDFHSYMTAGADGVITIYPDDSKKPLPDKNYMRGTMIHESGHTWSHRKWGDDESKGKWLEWKKAMTADTVSVSGYALASIAEDVSETIQVYGSTKGTPKFAEYAEIVPHRFAILKKELK